MSAEQNKKWVKTSVRNLFTHQQISWETMAAFCVAVNFASLMGIFADSNPVLMQPHGLISMFPIHKYKHDNTLTNAHSVSPGVRFRRSWCRCSSDNRLWQMSRLHLRAVTSPWTETNQHCHCVIACYRMESDFSVFFYGFIIICSGSLVHRSAVRTDLEAVQQSLQQKVSVSAWKRLPYYCSSGGSFCWLSVFKSSLLKSCAVNQFIAWHRCNNMINT